MKAEITPLEPHTHTERVDRSLLNPLRFGPDGPGVRFNPAHLAESALTVEALPKAS